MQPGLRTSPPLCSRRFLDWRGCVARTSRYGRQGRCTLSSPQHKHHIDFGPEALQPTVYAISPHSALPCPALPPILPYDSRAAAAPTATSPSPSISDSPPVVRSSVQLLAPAFACATICIPLASSMPA
ncbi:hypothetical protein P280DRAFT_464815, partial [Massarina eburnea CBS 473.64]